MKGDQKTSGKGKAVISRPPMRRAIISKCQDCSGDSAINRMFCHRFDCPLWFFRLFDSPGSVRYEKGLRVQWKNGEARIEEAKKRGEDLSGLTQAADAIHESKRMGIGLDHFLGYEKAPGTE